MIERSSATSSEVLSIRCRLLISGDFRESSMATIQPPTQEEEGEHPSPELPRRVWLFTHSQMQSSTLG